jgi:hypothetical protein
MKSRRRKTGSRTESLEAQTTEENPGRGRAAHRSVEGGSRGHPHPIGGVEAEPGLIQLEAVKKWNGALPGIMLGNTLPFMDMSKFVNNGQ